MVSEQSTKAQTYINDNVPNLKWHMYFRIFFQLRPIGAPSKEGGHVTNKAYIINYIKLTNSKLEQHKINFYTRPYNYLNAT